MGGGPNGLRGTDRVFAGWINNNVNHQVATAEYTGGHSGKYIFAANFPKRGTDLFFKKGDPAPVPLGLPKLDTLRTNGGTGGDTACMANSDITKRTDIAGKGTQLEVHSIDSPALSFLIDQPDFAGSKLTKVVWDQKFESYLSLWCNAGGVPGAKAAPGASDAAARLYSFSVDVEWEIKATWNINPKTLVITDGNAAPSVKITRTLIPLGFFQRTGPEVRPPGIESGYLVGDYQK